MDKTTYEKRVNIPLYLGKVIFLITNDFEKISKMQPVIGKDLFEEREAITFRVAQGGRGAFAIEFNLDVFKNRKINLGVIVHELTHFTHFVLEQAHVDADFDNDEAEAYLIGWAGDEIVKFLKANKFEIV